MARNSPTHTAIWTLAGWIKIARWRRGEFSGGGLDESRMIADQAIARWLSMEDWRPRWKDCFKWGFGKGDDGYCVVTTRSTPSMGRGETGEGM